VITVPFGEKTFPSGHTFSSRIDQYMNGASVLAPDFHTRSPMSGVVILAEENQTYGLSGLLVIEAVYIDNHQSILFHEYIHEPRQGLFTYGCDDVPSLIPGCA